MTIKHLENRLALIQTLQFARIVRQKLHPMNLWIIFSLAQPRLEKWAFKPLWVSIFFFKFQWNLIKIEFDVWCAWSVSVNLINSIIWKMNQLYQFELQGVREYKPYQFELQGVKEYFLILLYTLPFKLVKLIHFSEHLVY